MCFNRCPCVGRSVVLYYIMVCTVLGFTDVDECNVTVNACVPGQACTNTNGSFTCNGKIHQELFINPPREIKIYLNFKRMTLQLLTYQAYTSIRWPCYIGWYDLLNYPFRLPVSTDVYTDPRTAGKEGWRAGKRTESRTEPNLGLSPGVNQRRRPPPECCWIGVDPGSGDTDRGVWRGPPRWFANATCLLA
jgi:hypothetical protein